MGMTNETKMRNELDKLPTWHFDVDEPVYLDSKAVRLFSPFLPIATWFLVQKDDSDPEYPRWFGLCQVIAGYSELGWVSQYELFETKVYGAPAIKLDEYWTGTLGDGYDEFQQPRPSFIDATAPTPDGAS